MVRVAKGETHIMVTHKEAVEAVKKIHEYCNVSTSCENCQIKEIIGCTEYSYSPYMWDATRIAELEAEEK